MKLYLAINNGSEGWSLDKHDTKDQIITAIQTGDTFGREFKVLVELELKIEDYIQYHKQK